MLHYCISEAACFCDLFTISIPLLASSLASVRLWGTRLMKFREDSSNHYHKLRSIYSHAFLPEQTDSASSGLG